MHFVQTLNSTSHSFHFHHLGMCYNSRELCDFYVSWSDMIICILMRLKMQISFLRRISFFLYKNNSALQWKHVTCLSCSLYNYAAAAAAAPPSIPWFPFSVVIFSFWSTICRESWWTSFVILAIQFKDFFIHLASLRTISFLLI